MKSVETSYNQTIQKIYDTKEKIKADSNLDGNYTSAPELKSAETSDEKADTKADEKGELK